MKILKHLKFPFWGIIALFVFSCESEMDQAPVHRDADDSAITEELDGKYFAHAKGFSSLHNKILAEMRRATARYHRVEVAEADGYVGDPHCVSTPAGGMGYHYINFSLIDGEIDPSKPEVLVYEPQKNGKLKLVAVEFLVPAAAWPHDDPPMLGDQVFDDHTAPGSPGPPFPHYQLHAWVWKHNPSGIHAQFNPNVNCQFAQ